ncbi:hypothetical protein BDN72DRAFT_846151 [Pluteus cervinus]|uniref:Uncharacterized protein n=1 Tax=Pluteus cervinus TaxID=181527 RepID=A0ACD3AJD6_9AGAR|nr:hypothetical protein BDN72DRAFT_846151 [Pluteus cervinus]
MSLKILSIKQEPITQSILDALLRRPQLEVLSCMSENALHIKPDTGTKLNLTFLDITMPSFSADQLAGLSYETKLRTLHLRQTSEYIIAGEIISFCLDTIRPSKQPEELWNRVSSVEDPMQPSSLWVYVPNPQNSCYIQIMKKMRQDDPYHRLYIRHTDKHSETEFKLWEERRYLHIKLKRVE